LESVATKIQLEVERVKQSNAVEELVSVKNELASEGICLLDSREGCRVRAEEANSKSKEIERNVEELTADNTEGIALFVLCNSCRGRRTEYKCGFGVGKGEACHVGGA
jgi:hypothetical protein